MNKVFVSQALYPVSFSLDIYSLYSLTHSLTPTFNFFLTAIFSEPSSQIAFEGEVSVFSCLSNGTLFWQIDGEFYDISRAVELKNRGFIFSDTYSNGMTDRSVSIVGSRETNNTVIMCVSVDDDNQVTVSGNATLTVLGKRGIEGVSLLYIIQGIC